MKDTFDENVWSHIISEGKVVPLLEISDINKLRFTKDAVTTKIKVLKEVLYEIKNN